MNSEPSTEGKPITRLQAPETLPPVACDCGARLISQEALQVHQREACSAHQQEEASVSERWYRRWWSSLCCFFGFHDYPSSWEPDGPVSRRRMCGRCGRVQHWTQADNY